MSCQHPSARRQFLLIASLGAAGLPLAARAQAMVDPKDAQAAALGYVADAKSVDKKKFPKYAAGQLCSNCALYQGKATDKAAACPLFPGKQVAGPGWCSAWAKKA
jgi:High potential iron-sulfur protein